MGRCNPSHYEKDVAAVRNYGCITDDSVDILTRPTLHFSTVANGFSGLLVHKEIHVVSSPLFQQVLEAVNRVYLNY